jgi:hypothetical protein
MTYVNQFLIRKEIPKELRLKIRRYLEYVLNSKKTVKVDQDEVFSVLNKNLEIKMRAFLNGRILKNIKVFKSEHAYADSIGLTCSRRIVG